MKKIIYIGLLLLSTIWLGAQSTLSLDEAIAETMKHNYGIKMTKNVTQMSLNNVNPANAGLLPKLDLSGNMNFADNQIQQPDGELDQKFTNNSVSVGLSYTLFDGMGSLYSYQKLKSQHKESELQEKAFIENTLIQLINIYYQVASFQDNLKISEEMLDISGDRLERIITKKEFGRSSGLDLLNAKVDFNNDSINYINIQRQYDEAKRNLNMVMGMESSSEYSVETQIDPFKVYTLESLISEALEKNASYLLSKTKIVSSEIELKKVKSLSAPRLMLQSSYGYNQQTDNFAFNYNNPNVNFSAGLTLSFNLFDGGIKKTQRQNAKLSVDNLKLSMEEEKLNLKTKIENGYALYDNSLTVLNAERNNLASSQLNFEQSSEYFKLGQISSTQFREAQLNLNRAKTSISSAIFSAKLAEMELMRLTGLILGDS
jgi:outer membrane protein